MTQDEKDKFARSLNITPETCPQVWEQSRMRRCSSCQRIYHVSIRFCTEHLDDVCCDVLIEWHCTLPSPLSDAPAADFWVGPMMRELYERGLAPQLILGGGEACVVIGVPPNQKHYFNAQPAAALYSAIKAGEE